MNELPSRKDFVELKRRDRWIPVAVSLPLPAGTHPILTTPPFEAPWVLLESARRHPLTGRFSIWVGEPEALLWAQGDDVWLKAGARAERLHENPLDALTRLLALKPAVRLPGFPPFVGGAVGFLGYDAYRYTAPLPGRAPDDFGGPDLAFLFVNEAIVLDHLEERLWLMALADPALPPSKSYDQALGRIEVLKKRLEVSLRQRALAERGDAPQVTCTHTRASFEAMVRQAKTHIARGEIYQANLSQRFALPLPENPWELYRALRRINPSPFAAFADFSGTPIGGGFRIISASPERLLRVRGRKAETRPIAGTRPRGETREETLRLRKELLLSPKERSEHLMLVDLERNDLGRICRYGSVRVDEWMALEEYSHVVHIVSNVQGTLRPQVGAAEAMAAMFPGGTITGCPKIRCLEIIDALEPVRRGPYTGSLGYVSYTGDLDFNLLIRTAWTIGEKLYFQTGAGIVADSDPSFEYEETLHKAQALMEAFGLELHDEVPIAGLHTAAAL
ncbi:MAG: anthranilate synthase component I family protein [Candidatus Omnitrophica bacterium]|nr:anthranilate synthase component I family protein [Candidatus Omnitrophota bacterium]